MHKEENPTFSLPIQPTLLDDRSLIERIECSKAANDWRSLYEQGDTRQYNDDHSSADMALCHMLAFWCGRDEHQMDRLFRGSALMRAKWDRNAGGGQTYGQRTIQKAISNCRETYEPRYNGSVSTTSNHTKHQGATPSNVSEEEEWQAGLIRTKADRSGFRSIKSTPVNVVKILSHDKNWKDVLGFDEFQNSPVFLKKPQFSEEYDISFARGQKVEDLDVDRITYWLAEHWGISIGSEAAYKAILAVAWKHSFHPVREYLESLVWDGAPRIDDWLLTYMHARHESQYQREYIQLVGKWWLLSAVARVFVPGAKADYVLVLEGKEGIRKSSALRVLAGEWFTDAALDLNNKDAYLQIQGAWIVEIAELDALMKAESATAKAFFTRSTDRYRPPYGRNIVDIKRQCVCAGTVNHNDYIKDYTGGRRYWPVWCRSVDLEQLIADRDQLWAEAVHHYKQNERYWPEGAYQRMLCSNEQQSRQIDDPWEANIVYWLLDRQRTTTAEILEGAIKMERDRWNRGHQTRIGQIMTRLGWRRERKRQNGKLQTFYIAPVKEDEL
jgi:putative DNA primase/helicase